MRTFASLIVRLLSTYLISVSMTNPRKRRRRVVQEINNAEAENFSIMTESDMTALNNELSANGMARKVSTKSLSSMSLFQVF